MNEHVTIRLIQKADKSEYLRMRLALWPDEEHEEVLEHFFTSSKPDWVTFVAERDNSNLGGFVEVSERLYAEGCETSPVGYIEGWYVDPDLQRRGVGRSLVQAAEGWASEQGFTEMGSDALIKNETSLKAHAALGYQEIERIICFAKKLK
jgi:aminoglycoside 6'-N-acetyltransferase I